MICINSAKNGARLQRIFLGAWGRASLASLPSATPFLDPRDDLEQTRENFVDTF